MDMVSDQYDGYCE